MVILMNLTDHLKFYLNNPKQAQESVIRGQNYIMRNLEWDKITIELERMYEKIYSKNL